MKVMLSRYKHAIRDFQGSRNGIVDTASHIGEAVRWIFRAQDGTPDRGLSHSYAIGKGWTSSYPETTGYVIPTLLNWAEVCGDVAVKQRALEMADWETSIQLEDGGVIGSVVGGRVGSGVVFNTGQVLFGWIAAHRSTGDERYLAAATRAGEWLLRRLDTTGTWSTHGNMGADAVHTYNIRVAWALLELWRLTQDLRYRTAASLAADWCLGQETSDGWFRYNCLTDNARPLLHTIGYTAQGLLECGLILERDDCVAAAGRIASALAPTVRGDGWMAGRFDSRWQPAARWACLTGMSQMAVVWSRLSRIAGSDHYRKTATKVNRFVQSTQNLSSADPGVRGGIQGSYPVYGEYGRYRLLNWAAKFFIDALLLELRPEFPDSPGYFPG